MGAGRWPPACPQPLYPVRSRRGDGCGYAAKAGARIRTTDARPGPQARFGRSGHALETALACRESTARRRDSRRHDGPGRPVARLRQEHHRMPGRQPVPRGGCMAGRPGPDPGVMMAYPCRYLPLRVDDVSAPPAQGCADGSQSRVPGMRNGRAPLPWMRPADVQRAEPALRRQGNTFFIILAARAPLSRADSLHGSRCPHVRPPVCGRPRPARGQAVRLPRPGSVLVHRTTGTPRNLGHRRSRLLACVS